MAPATDDVIAALDALREEVECCSSCALAETRTRAVFGEGDPGADLMFVGEAPGYHEDQQGRPFVGQAGKLLEQLLASIGLTREQVYIANVLKSRPPNNRDPRPEEIDACRPYLLAADRDHPAQGHLHARQLRDQAADRRPARHHPGARQPRATEIAGHRLYLYPIFHPAAALYTPAKLATLKEDFLRLPELLAHAAPQPGEEAAPPPAAERPAWQPPARLRAAGRAARRSARAGADRSDEAPPAPATSAPAVAFADPAPDGAGAGACAQSRRLPAPDVRRPPLRPRRRTTPDAAPTPQLGSARRPSSRPSRDDPAPASPPAPEAGPPAEPEQLGLF